MQKQYKVKAEVDGQLIEDIVMATDPYDAVDAFEIQNNCFNNGKWVAIKNVEEIK